MAVHIDADGRQCGTSCKLQLSTEIHCCEPVVQTACTYMNGIHVTSPECHSQAVLVNLVHLTTASSIWSMLPHSTAMHCKAATYSG